MLETWLLIREELKVEAMLSFMTSLRSYSAAPLPHSVCYNPTFKSGPYSKGEELVSSFYRKSAKDFINRF